MGDQAFIGRQPILDIKQKLLGMSFFSGETQLLKVQSLKTTLKPAHKY